MGEAEFFAAMRVEDVPNGKGVAIEIGGRSVLVCNSDGAFFAIANRCSHADESLECGRIRNGWIACPAHGARFDLETGEALNPPAIEPIATFAVRIVAGMIEVAQTVD